MNWDIITRSPFQCICQIWIEKSFSAGDWERADDGREMNLNRYYIQQEIFSQSQREALLRDFPVQMSTKIIFSYHVTCIRLHSPTFNSNIDLD